MKAKNGLAPLLALVAAVAAVTACRAPGGWMRAEEQGLFDGGKPPCPSDGGACVEVSPPSALGGSCTDDRWLAYFKNPDTVCPSLAAGGGTWEGSKLFAEADGPGIPPGLKSYCLYEWAPPPASPGNPPNVAALTAALTGTGAVSALERDCFVAGPSGSSMGVNVGWPWLLQGFHGETGWLPQLPAGANETPAKVRVAVVDTAPNYYSAGAPGDDRSGHGHSVGWIIRDHACPSANGTCIGQVADRLAMPRLSLKTKDPLHGGYFGSEGEVAKAIHGAVHVWRAFKAGGGNQPRLVINLSLGWDPGWGGDPNSPSGMPLGTRAVYAAITHAVCQGALVVAAAGNDPGGPGIARGPMYPGAWEQQPAPTAAQCAAVEDTGWTPGGPFPLLPPAGSGVYNPLVFAVSGVRADDQPLLNARPGGRARLVAPGAQALAMDGADPTTVLYGTSAAAAVATSTAAAVWGYRPKLTAPEVMDLIRSSATPLTPAADFCLGSSHPCARSPAEAQVRRVNLCQAIAAACPGPLESCPATPPACALRPAYGGTPPRLPNVSVTAMQAAATTTYDASPVQWVLAGLPETCEDAAIVTTGPRYPDAPCPKRQFFGTAITPWTGPQPATNACPVCTIGQQSAAPAGTYSVTLSIDDEYASVGDPVLRINGQYDIDLSGMGTVDGGTVAVINDLDLSAIPSVDTAEIQFRMADGTGDYSTESELIVQ